MDKPAFDTSYSGRTANKTARAPGQKPTMIVYHETASPDPSNPIGTLRFNLSASVGSSYHYLVARDGTIYEYLRPAVWIAWHAGPSVARGLRDWEVNLFSIGIELDGRNNGEPATDKQMTAAARLVAWLCQEFNIPPDRAYHLTHREIAIPQGRKSDPRGYSVDTLLQLARQHAGPPAPPPPPPPMNPQVLGLSPLQIETTEGHWLRSLERQQAHERGLSVAAQRHLYSQCRRLGVEPWFVLGILNNETQFGRNAAGPAHNWMNIRECCDSRPSIVVMGRDFERHGAPELGIERGIIHLADCYAYLFKLTNLREVLERWAPATDENDPAAYATKVLGDRAYILSH